MASGTTRIARPRMPRAVRLLNAAGRGARAVGWQPVRLDEASLLAAATREAGLDDFGDGAFREPLRALLASLEREAHLSLLGRTVARRDVLRLLVNRLGLVEARRRHPAIADERVERPIVVVGLPRTGTTILHELLARDPENRTPLTWEVMFPCPPPERASYESDPRIDEAARHFSGVDRVLPDFKKMHRMGAQLPQECAALMQHDFASMIFHTAYRVPSYQAWLERADLGPIYASHRRQLQHLQWRCRGARWVLKSPVHLWGLDALLAEYPDARIVQTHRDPLKVVASLTSLIATLRGMTSDRVDSYEIGADWAKRLAEGLQKAMDVRDRGVPETARIADLHFSDLMADEVGAIRRLYAQFGLELGAEAEARMRRHLAAHPQHEHGAHRYSLAASGLDLAAERRRFAAYQERHGVASEPVA